MMMIDYPTAHIFNSDRLAHTGARLFAIAHADKVTRKEETKTTCMLELSNGEAHYFMSKDVAKYWTFARYYYIDGALYYSGAATGTEG